LTGSRTAATPAALGSKSAAGRRCGYAFSYDEHCGRLVANSMQVFTSTQSLDTSATGVARTLCPPRSSSSVELAAGATATEVDEAGRWCSAGGGGGGSDVDDEIY